MYKFILLLVVIIPTTYVTYELIQSIERIQCWETIDNYVQTTPHKEIIESAAKFHDKHFLSLKVQDFVEYYFSLCK